MKPMIHCTMSLMILICMGSFTALQAVALQPMATQPIATISLEQLNHELQPALKKKSHLYVINVLPRGIYADCKIPRSINIPLHRLARKAQHWPKNRNIVLYCAGQNCPLGKYAYEALSKLGLKKIRLFEGGLREWVAEHKPTVGLCRAGYLQG